MRSVFVEHMLAYAAYPPKFPGPHPETGEERNSGASEDISKPPLEEGPAED